MRKMGHIKVALTYQKKRAWDLGLTTKFLGGMDDRVIFSTTEKEMGQCEWCLCRLK